MDVVFHYNARVPYSVGLLLLRLKSVNQDTLAAASLRAGTLITKNTTL